MKKKLFTVYTFARVNTRRFFRDKTAIFFTVMFPLIFLFVFGGIFGGSNDTSFKVALINNSESEFAQTYEKQAIKSKLLNVDEAITTVDQADEKMSRSEIDATIILPSDFGAVKEGEQTPSGTAKVVYVQNNEQAGQTLTSILEGQFKQINSQFVTIQEPFTVSSQQTQNESLSRFDYTFAGLLGFSIIGIGIFGPINVFPELKKQGILRRFHTTTLRVWQYFTATMASQAVIGMVSVVVQFAVAITIFNLNVVGNYFELAIFLILSIVTILGIGLAVGGWAKNERQAAPLANLIVFPMMFLSGTFFPRFLMPEWLQNASGLLPLTPVIDGIRLIATEGKHLTQIGPQLGLLVAWMIIVYVIAFRVFRWE